jgi:hypothetical protein
MGPCPRAGLTVSGNVSISSSGIKRRQPEESLTLQEVKTLFEFPIREVIVDIIRLN